MGTNTGHIMTLANSIIGVSVLAMPFCYKQCGIVLASLMLIISSVMTRLSCYYLIKSAILARRRNFEFLAFHAFGPMGKLTVELCTIGFLLGTCIAFFVVMGDLGPAILGPVMGLEDPTSIRATVLIAIALFVVLPLGLLRNVDSLAAISAATIAFYICLVVKVMGEATTNLVTWDWLDKVVMWRPAGLLQCIPIFSMALSCQTQLFEIFDSIPNATLDKMNVIVKSAVNMCTLMYMAMGFFGYVAFCTQSFSGNLMLSFSPTPTSEVVKMGFVLSVAVSFPLVIFPCRASLHSLLFRKGIPPHQELLSVSNHMPEARFKSMTVGIVGVSLVTGMLIPNIELVLGLVGSTIGVLICIIIPASLFLSVTTKHNNDRLLAQVLFFMGLTIMILGSYANLFASEENISKSDADLSYARLQTINNLPKDAQFKGGPLEDIKHLDQLVPELPKVVLEKANTLEIVNDNKDGRKEPPIPVAPEENILSENNIQPKLNVDTKDLISKAKEASILESNAIYDKEEEKNADLKIENEDIKSVKQQEILKIEQLQQKEANLAIENQQLKDTKEVSKGLTFEQFKNDIPSKHEDETNEKIPIEPNNINNIVKPAFNSLVNHNQEKQQKADVPIQNRPLLRIQDNVKEVVPIKDDDKQENNVVKLVLPSVMVEKLSPQAKNVESVKTVHDHKSIDNNPEAKVFPKNIVEENKENRQREKRDLNELNDDVANRNKPRQENIDDPDRIKVKQENIQSTNVEKKAGQENVDDPRRNTTRLENIESKNVVMKDEQKNVDDTRRNTTRLENIESNNVAMKDRQKNADDTRRNTTRLENIGNNNAVKNEDKHQAITAKKMSSPNFTKSNVDKKNITKTVIVNKEPINKANEQSVELPKKNNGNGIKEEIDINDHCSDETKTKSSLSIVQQHVNEISRSQRNEKTEVEFKKLQKNASSKKVVDTSGTTESIIKSPIYLSNPVLILPDDKGKSILENNDNNVKSIPKPMKRDLKSLDITQERKKETEP